MNCSSCNYLIAMPPAYATCLASCKKNENFDHDNELSSEEKLQKEVQMSMLCNNYGYLCNYFSKTI
jgi:hypothetical protein